MNKSDQLNQSWKFAIYLRKLSKSKDTWIMLEKKLNS
jgi:hypothetical protein